ncbi:MAG: cupin [Alphaproteobacteria bacterium]|nr:cupin [Alphaproteobacteria bacterium]
MDVNADFARRAALHSNEIPWRQSPIKGVARRMLDRLGDEVARATSIVRYDPGSAFAPHVHGGGEQFIVLEGVFQDEHGDFPAGSYIRNPPGSSHTPRSGPGCVIFVKLWQFDPTDRAHIRLAMDRMEAIPDPLRPGVAVTPLYRDAVETVRREFWQPGTTAAIERDGGAEIFVLNGTVEESGERFGRHDWLRLPHGETAPLTAGEEGAELYVKTGHLRHAKRPPAA